MQELAAVALAVVGVFVAFAAGAAFNSRQRLGAAFLNLVVAVALVAAAGALLTTVQP